MDWQAFALTLKLATLVAALLALLGVPIAYWITLSRWRWKFLAEAVVMLPIVLPPTVLGFYLLVALGSRSPDVILIQLFEHGGADHARQDGGERASHRDCGKDQVGQAAGAGDWKPAEFDGEEQDQNWSEREVWEREAEEAHNRKQPIVPVIAASGGADSGGNREHDRDEEARQREAQRVRIAERQKFCDRLVVADGAAEVAVEDAFPVSDVLFTERGVEAEGVTSGGDVGGRGAFAEHLLDGVSGDEVD